MEKTKSQKEALDYLREQILLNDGLRAHVDEHEYKEFCVTEGDSGTVYLYTVVGSKGDEGTMAAAICRTYRHIAIGKRGGLQLLNGKKKNVTGSAVVWSRTI